MKIETICTVCIKIKYFSYSSAQNYFTIWNQKRQSCFLYYWPSHCETRQWGYDLIQRQSGVVASHIKQGWGVQTIVSHMGFCGAVTLILLCTTYVLLRFRLTPKYKVNMYMYVLCVNQIFLHTTVKISVFI